MQKPHPMCVFFPLRVVSLSVLLLPKTKLHPILLLENIFLKIMLFVFLPMIYPSTNHSCQYLFSRKNYDSNISFSAMYERKSKVKFGFKD